MAAKLRGPLVEPFLGTLGREQARAMLGCERVEQQIVERDVEELTNSKVSART
jgi:hypothetical protein